MKKAVLALADGKYYEGWSFGAEGSAGGEVVFNTSMTGYQEILTDPSYKGQMVIMTYPLIGNYGVSPEDVESGRPWAEGFIVKEYSEYPSNWRSQGSLDSYMKSYGIVGIQGLDTRALTKYIRDNGAQQGIISTLDIEPAELCKKAAALPSMAGQDLAKEVTCAAPYKWVETEWDLENGYGEVVHPKLKVVVYDCGLKRNIPRILAGLGCDVTIVPATTSWQDVMAMEPDGVMLGNGPGDPEPLTYVIENVRQLIGKVPIFGICLGIQLLGLALGGKTYKLKFGHHGGNQPVMDLTTRKVEITAQNHGFAVDVESIPGDIVELTHVNLNDKTVEGFRHKELPIFAVQYHPEASPGPHDSHYLFDRFVAMMEIEKLKKAE
ncbi:MAG: glutamine-hydrolyzing carbamoyl-phosphate synthase small subunit [Nitrospirae bacterium]|nr:glutamine-hydrolyzing carbamoyl-phosphate synthase small subunit [Nitrospirota bacterium]